MVCRPDERAFTQGGSLRCRVQQTCMELIPHRQFGNLRTIVIDNTPWFCGKDVAKALDYAQPPHALKRHVGLSQKCIYATLQEALSMVAETGTSSELHPHTVFINEAGVYSLAMGSRLPTAVAFKDWVCEEVLPTIRKYGTYTMWRELRNEKQLHYELCKFVRAAYPNVRISPGLGENQDSGQKRAESWCKGYQKGQPYLIIHQRSATSVALPSS